MPSPDPSINNNTLMRLMHSTLRHAILFFEDIDSTDIDGENDQNKSLQHKNANSEKGLAI